MKIFTSYFYQLRFFKPYMIPLSTAMYDPKWYHMNRKDKSFVFLDKNGVYNGLRIEPLVPSQECEGLCPCEINDPENCKFLTTYRSQLDKININDLIESLHQFEVLNKTDHETYIVFMVYEPYGRACSERTIIRQWGNDNGVDIPELFKEAGVEEINEESLW